MVYVALRGAGDVHAILLPLIGQSAIARGRHAERRTLAHCHGLPGRLRGDYRRPGTAVTVTGHFAVAIPPWPSLTVTVAL